MDLDWRHQTRSSQRILQAREDVCGVPPAVDVLVEEKNSRSGVKSQRREGVAGWVLGWLGWGWIRNLRVPLVSVEERSWDVIHFSGGWWSGGCGGGVGGPVSRPRSWRGVGVWSVGFCVGLGIWGDGEGEVPFEEAVSRGFWVVDAEGFVAVAAAETGWCVLVVTVCLRGQR